MSAPVPSRQAPTLYRDRGRLAARVAPDMIIGVKCLSETHARRQRWGIHAYAVVEITCSAGTMIFRNIEIRWDAKRGKFRYPRFPGFFTGIVHNNGWKEKLDVAGPLDHETRKKVSNRIMSVFYWVKREAADQSGEVDPYLEALQQQMRSTSSAQGGEVGEEDEDYGDELGASPGNA